jgi:hypothetical protein
MARQRRPSVLSPFAFARRNGIYKGLLGGDRTWLVLGGIVWGGRMLKKTLGKVEEVVAVEKLEPGQWMSLRTITPQERKAERKAARAARAS